MPRKEAAVTLGLCSLGLLGFIGIGVWLTDSYPSQKERGSQVQINLGAYEIAARLEPTKAMNFKRLGKAYKMSGRLREAVSAYVAASELAPGDTEIQRALIKLRAMAEARGRH